MMTKTIHFRIPRSFVQFLKTLESKLDFREKVIDDNSGIELHIKIIYIEGQLPQNYSHQQKTYFRCVENYHKLTHPVMHIQRLYNYIINKKLRFFILITLQIINKIKRFIHLN